MASRPAHFTIFIVLSGSTRTAILSEGSLEGELGVGEVFPRQGN